MLEQICKKFTNFNDEAEPLFPSNSDIFLNKRNANAEVVIPQSCRLIEKNANQIQNDDCYVDSRIQNVLKCQNERH